MSTRDIVTIVFSILILLAIGFFVLSAVGWVFKTEPYKVIWAKYRGDIKKLDKIRKRQFILKQENDIFITEKKEKFTDKLYNFVAKTNIVKHFPSMSVSDVINFGALGLIILFIVLSLIFGIPKAFLYVVFVIIILFAIGKNVIYRNRFNVEKQMYDFINACSSASTITPNIIDIFGNIYVQMDAPLSGLLEECYLEARQTHDEQMALKHLRNKLDSFMFQTVIDAFSTASQMNEGYKTVLEFLRPIVSNNDELVNTQLASIRNTRVELAVMFGIGMVILFAMQFFVESAGNVLLTSFVGQFLLVCATGVIILGMTMHPK